MSNMQVFHKQLFSTAQTPDQYQHSLERLTHLNRHQLMNVTGEITWFIWNAEELTVAQ